MAKNNKTTSWLALLIIIAVAAFITGRAITTNNQGLSAEISNSKAGTDNVTFLNPAGGENYQLRKSASLLWQFSGVKLYQMVDNLWLCKYTNIKNPPITLGLITSFYPNDNRNNYSWSIGHYHDPSTGRELSAPAGKDYAICISWEYSNHYISGGSSVSNRFNLVN